MVLSAGSVLVAVVALARTLAVLVHANAALARALVVLVEGDDDHGMVVLRDQLNGHHDESGADFCCTVCVCQPPSALNGTHAQSGRLNWLLGRWHWVYTVYLWAPDARNDTRPLHGSHLVA